MTVKKITDTLWMAYGSVRGVYFKGYGYSREEAVANWMLFYGDQDEQH